MALPIFPFPALSPFRPPDSRWTPPDATLARESRLRGRRLPSSGGEHEESGGARLALPRCFRSSARWTFAELDRNFRRRTSRLFTIPDPRRADEPVKVEAVFGKEIREPLRLLENSLRDGESLSEEFVSRMESLVETGDIEVLTASEDDRAIGEAIGVLVLAFRPNVSLGGDFASIEEFFVEPGERRRGVGRKLIEKAAERCRRRGVSYVEVHTEEDEAVSFYARLGYEEEEDVRVFSRSYPL